MNWRYAHQKSGEAAICYWAGTLIFVVVLLIETFASTAPEVFSFEWIESIVKITIFTVFIYYCGWLCDSQQRGFSKWYKQMVKTGVKCDGQVVSIQQIIVRGDHGTRETNSYNLQIKYYSLLNRQDVYYWENVVKFDEVDQSKTILCDVYETTKPVEQISYEEGLIDFVERENGKTDIHFHFSPIKLFSAVHKKYTRTTFGNQVATNFRYEENEG